MMPEENNPQPVAPPEEATPITMGDVRDLFAAIIDEKEQETQRNLTTTSATLEAKHNKEVRSVSGRAVKHIWTVFATILGAAFLGGFAFWMQVRDTVKLVENLDMPTEMETLQLIEKRAPWVKDKPVVMGKIDDLAEDMEDISEEIKSIDDSVDAMRIEQYDLMREVLAEVKKNGGG